MSELLNNFREYRYGLNLDCLFTQFTSYLITTVSAKTNMAHVEGGLDVVSHLALHPKLTVGLHSLKTYL